MKIVLDLNKNVNENATKYFEKSKKLKKKIERIKEIIKKYSKELEELKKNSEINKANKEFTKDNKRKRIKEKKWYEKFRWFLSSKGFLVIAGKDATTNEIVIKKHTNKNDLVLHTDLPGSPFTVIRNEENKEIDKKTIEEAAIFTASYSKAWNQGVSFLEVFYVKPEQVSKKTESGEYMGKGSFMIRGKKNYISVPLEICIGLLNNEIKIMAGPESAIREHCKKYVKVVFGNMKKSDAAKKIKKILNYDELDDIVRVLPGKVSIIGTFLGKNN